MMGVCTMAAAWVLAQSVVASAPPRARMDAGAPLALESTAQGPFTLGGHTFRVIVHATRAEWAEETSAVAYVVVDDKGRRWFEDRLPTVPPARGGFEIFVEALQGQSGKGFLIHTQAYPGVRGTGASFRVLSLGARALTPLPPARLFAIGEGVRLKPGAPDALVFTASNPYFAIECPLIVDWAKGFRPRKGPGELTAIVKRPSRPARAGVVSLVRHPAIKKAPIPVAVRPESLIQFHQAWGEVELTDVGEVRVKGGEPWLQVSIDGQRGWTRSPQDFEALGLIAQGGEQGRARRAPGGADSAR